MEKLNTKQILMIRRKKYRNSAMNILNGWELLNK